MAEWLCYTDGSAKTGDGAPGGWGVFIKLPSGATLEGHGHAVGTLAKVMEYRAVAEALALLPAGVSAVVFSDNQSLVENLTKRLETWRSSDFRNVDLLVVESVRRIASLIAEQELTIRFQWVKSHNGNAGNERADALATQGTREAKELTRRGPRSRAD